MENISEKNETPPPNSSSIDSSRKPRFPHHFGLSSARQGMQKALSSMRPTPTITGLSLRKKPSTSKLALTTNRATTPHKMEIGAPTGVVKKTPEELQEMLREMGYADADLPSHISSSSSKGRVGAAVAGREIEDMADSEKKKGKRVVGSESMASISTDTSTHVPAFPAVKPAATPQLSEKQRGKLPAREESSSSIDSAASQKLTLIPDMEEKPVGWYATATLDEIRATLPKIEKKDLIPDEEIPEFLAGLVRDLNMLKSVSAWRSEQIEQEVEELVEAHLAKMFGDKEVMVDETGDDVYGHADEDGNVNYTWGEFGEPDPRFVDCGWGQVDVSSRGVGKCWFVFGDVDDVLGGPKCPLTHGGFEEGQESVGVTEESLRETEKAEEADHAQDQQSTRTIIDEDEDEDEDKDRFADADEDYDEDAQNLTQVEILLREGML
ncbi:hypothetical protein EYC80_005359 [Monilinia laxa]|uniref:Uncharacterized protein n=1 Tax=Monilinia laxa TaxID=61186 RepID=A0A5N6KLG3_MONLA|nr:hypothetical protein EYC80_005359 [Monilinia laxa]